MDFISLGTRNKGTFWEYLSADAFIRTKLPGSKFEINYFLAIGEGMPNKHCHHISDIEKNSKIFIEEFEKGLYSDEYFKKLIHLYTDELENLRNICAAKNFKHFSNEELADMYVKVSNAVASPYLPMLQALYTRYLIDFFHDELIKVLSDEEKNDTDKTNRLKSLLLSKVQPTATDEEELLVNELRETYQERFKDGGFKKFFSDPEIKSKIKNLAERYGWLYMEYAQQPFTEKEYRNYIQETIDDDYDIEGREKTKKEIEAFFKAHPAPYLKSLADVFQKFSYILDHSKDILVYGRFLSLLLFAEISKRLKISADELLFLVPPEVVQYLMLNKNADRGLIDERKKKRIILMRENLITIYQGHEAEIVEKKYFQEEGLDNLNYLKGLSAYPGKIIGKAVIVQSSLDYDKFKKGDILVTHDGTAELTLFLKKAGAIVTNEGGMICHSASIAREMKTPCIVAAKFATKFLKTGDIIEVDADKGIIKKIRE